MHKKAKKSRDTSIQRSEKSEPALSATKQRQKKRLAKLQSISLTDKNNWVERQSFFQSSAQEKGELIKRPTPPGSAAAKQDKSQMKPSKSKIGAGWVVREKVRNLDENP